MGALLRTLPDVNLKHYSSQFDGTSRLSMRANRMRIGGYNCGFPSRDARMNCAVGTNRPTCPCQSDHDGEARAGQDSAIEHRGMVAGRSARAVLATERKSIGAGRGLRLNAAYVIKTDFPENAALKESVHNRFKGVPEVEQAFRRYKSAVRCLPELLTHPDLSVNDVACLRRQRCLGKAKN
jgi:hypothetical protein